MALNPSQLRWRRLNKLWHVGTLNPADKGNDSQEGQGLSVSVHPREWSSIAKLGSTVFELRRPGGRFLDFHALSKGSRQGLMQWGQEAGYLEAQPMWQVAWMDDEAGAERFTLFAEEAKAREEAEFMADEGTEGVTLSPQNRLVLSAKAISRLGFKLDPLLSEDITATFWVEDCTDADGVWWNDTLDPYSLSAPRGVINLSQLPRWAVHGPTAL